MMKNLMVILTLFFNTMFLYGNVNDSISYDIDEVTVVGFYNNSFTTSETITKEYAKIKEMLYRFF